MSEDKNPFFSTLTGIVTRIEGVQAYMMMDLETVERAALASDFERAGIVKEGQKFKIDIFERPDRTPCSRIYVFNSESMGITPPQNPVLLRTEYWVIDRIIEEFAYLTMRNKERKEYRTREIPINALSTNIPEPYEGAFVKQELYVEDDNTIATKYFHDIENEDRFNEELLAYLNSPEVKERAKELEELRRHSDQSRNAKKN